MLLAFSEKLKYDIFFFHWFKNGLKGEKRKQ